MGTCVHTRACLDMPAVDKLDVIDKGKQMVMRSIATVNVATFYHSIGVRR